MYRKANREKYLQSQHRGDSKPTRRKLTRIRQIARNAVRSGHLQRQPCAISGCPSKAQMHHPDYDKPLEVEWYCPEHHRALHQRERDRVVA